jgi:hypothetical protein
MGLVIQRGRDEQSFVARMVTQETHSCFSLKNLTGQTAVRSESRCAHALRYVDLAVSMGCRGHHFQYLL